MSAVGGEVKNFGLGLTALSVDWRRRRHRSRDLHWQE